MILIMEKHIKWFLPLLFLAGIAPFTPALDLSSSGFFYSPETGFVDDPFFTFLFHYGELFGLATGGLAASIFLLSLIKPSWKKWRRGSFAVVLTLIIGAGLLTNTLLKGYWGRPRPKQIEQFGGHQEYRPFWKPNFHAASEPHRSFPSGHVAMGFYFLSVCLLGRRIKNRPLFVMGVILTACLGGSLMVTRVAQGGHFLSDVLVSPVLMWFVALWIDAFTWGEAGARVLFLKQSDTSLESDDAAAA